MSIMSCPVRFIAIILILLTPAISPGQPTTAPAAPAKLRLGVKLLPSDDPGALVSEVMIGYAAEVCGLKAGDRVVKVGETPIDDVESFRHEVAKLNENSVVPFTVERNGAEHELTIRMSPPRDDAPGSKPPTLPALRDELLAMMEKDQAPRKPLIDGNVTPEEQQKLMEEMKEVDAANRQRLKAIIDKHGYPTISMVGRDAAEAAFLIVQHADADPQWQASMLGVLEPLAKKGEVGKSELAYLTDRVRHAQGKPQLYATQYDQEPGPDGQPRYVAPLVEDPANLDKRRLEMGLGPWAQYEAYTAQTQNREVFPEVRAPGGK